MRHLEQLPPAAAIIIAIFVVVGSSLALLGSLGLVRQKSFYQRLHAPTLAYSYGAFLIILGSMAMFSLIEDRPVVHELVIGVFLLITTPITLLMLGRAALRRDRDTKLGHDEVVPPRAPRADIAVVPPRDLSDYGEGVLDRGLLGDSKTERTPDLDDATDSGPALGPDAEAPPQDGGDNVGGGGGGADTASDATAETPTATPADPPAATPSGKASV